MKRNLLLFQAALLAGASDAMAQDADTAETPQQADPGAGGFSADILDIISTEPLKALIAAIVGIFIVPVLQNVAHRSRINKIFSGVKVAKGHRKNSIMLLGLGDSGKTTLSRRLCGDMKKKPSEETDTFTLFQGNSTKDGQVFDYYISDYRGQNVGTLVTGFIEQQLQERSPFRFGDVNSLILVVDIAAPDADLRDVEPENHPKIEAFDDERVNENVQQWNRTALDAVFGLHTVDSLRYVCLFINKRDRLKNWSDAALKKVRKAFEPLEDDLRRRCFYEDDKGMKKQYALFEVIVGTAAQEMPVALLDNLQALSVPLAEDFGEVKAKLEGA